MSKEDKFFFLFGPVAYSFIFAAASPTVRIWFASVIDPKVVAAANLIEMLLAAVVHWTFTKEELQEVYRRWIGWIILVDCILFSVISITGLSYPELRYLGFAFINAVSTCIWLMVLRNAANRVIVDGDQRTAFDALESMCCLIAGFFGGLIAICISSRDIEVVQYCIFAECIVNAVMGIADMYAFRRLEHKAVRVVAVEEVKKP